MRTIETNDYRIDYFDETVYTAEQTIVRVIDKHSGIQIPYKSVALKTDRNTTLATYLFADKVVEIDLTEWMRLHANDLIKSVILVFDTGELITLTWEHVGLYDVSKIVRKQSIVALSVDSLTDSSITPPSAVNASVEDTLIVMPFNKPAGVRVRANYKSSSEDILMSLDADTIAVSTRSGGESLTSFDIIGTRGESDIVRVYTREAVCGHQYALVRWLFPTGDTVQHLIEVRDVTDTTADSYSLRTIDGSFATHKGAGQSFKLYIDELTAYDYWYYGTIVTSSNVEISFDNGDTWKRVDVATKKLTQPNGNGGKLAKISIEVTYSKHTAL